MPLLRTIPKIDTAENITVNRVCSHKKLPHRYWNDLTNQRSFLEDVAKKLNIHDESGWKTITVKILQQYGGHGVLRKYDGSPSKLVATVFPEYRDLRQDLHIQHI